MFRVGTVLLLAVVLAASGCKSTRSASINDGRDPSEENVLDQGGFRDPAAGLDGGSLPDLPPGTMFGYADDLEPIYFDYDSSTLSAEAMAAIERNAARLNAAGSRGYVQIAGHCDERGTQEYNLALGERRALSVREHLMRLGVDGNRLVTMSYGEESPANPAQNESAFAQNRRAEFYRQSN